MGSLAQQVRAKQQEELDNNTSNLSIIGTSVLPAPYGMNVYRQGEITGNPKLKAAQAAKLAQLEKTQMPKEVAQVEGESTIHLIEKLDDQSKKTLNALVQSVLMT